MSPRKSSTSSGSPTDRRPRYLGVEVVGGPTVPRGWLEETLLRSLPPTPQGNGRFRIVRFERARALVEVGHDAAADARKAWNATWRGPGGATIAISTRRTWGTLRKAKQWLATSTDRTGRRRST